LLYFNCLKHANLVKYYSNILKENFMAEDNEIIDEIFLEFEEKNDKAISHFKNELLSIRAGRANPHVLDKITVDYYGTQTPLAHVSNISVQDARMLVIAPWDISLV